MTKIFNESTKKFCLILFSISLILLALPMSKSTNVLTGCITDHFIVDSGNNHERFNMVVLGDSIAWGAGLEQNQKYYYYVAHWLNGKLDRPVDVKVLAHTGAKLKGHSDNTPYDPDCPNPYPSVEDQISCIQHPDSIDLVLLSGGANDVGVLNVIDSDMTGQDIARLCKTIGVSMPKILDELLNRCNKAKIIVTGYYPIITDETRNEDLDAFYKYIYEYGLNHESVAMPSNYKIILVDNSRIFFEESTRYLKEAVNGTNNEDVIFVPVNFPSDKCYATIDSWLWRIDHVDLINRELIPNDAVWEYRRDICHPDDIESKKQDIVGSIAHPNLEGAIKYARAIEDAIDRKGLNWLAPSILAPLAESATSAPVLDGSCNPTEAESWFEKGEAAYNQDKYQESIEYYDGAINICPYYAKAWCGKAIALVDINKYDEALQACDKAIEFDPELAKAWATKGGALYWLKRSDESLQACDKAIELDPQSAYAWNCKSVILMNLNRYDEALQAAESAVKFNSGTKKIWYNYGAALYYSGRYDEAVQAFDEENKINPEWADAWQFKGLSLKKCNKDDEAKIAFKRAAELGYSDLFSFYYLMS